MQSPLLAHPPLHTMRPYWSAFLGNSSWLPQLIPGLAGFTPSAQVNCATFAFKMRVGQKVLFSSPDMIFCLWYSTLQWWFVFKLPPPIASLQTRPSRTASVWQMKLFQFYYYNAPVKSKRGCRSCRKSTFLTCTLPMMFRSAVGSDKVRWKLRVPRCAVLSL